MSAQAAPASQFPGHLARTKIGPCTAIESEQLGFSAVVSVVDLVRVVCVTGELDIATRDVLYSACVSGDQPTVMVDLAHLQFMDCGGYVALVVARRVLEQRHATLILHHLSGQPLRLHDVLTDRGLAA